jgi:hypothetical protein
MFFNQSRKSKYKQTQSTFLTAKKIKHPLSRKHKPALCPGRRRENECRRGIEKFSTMMFSYAKHIQPRLIRKFNPLNQITDTIRLVDFRANAVARGSCGKAVNTESVSIGLCILYFPLRVDVPNSVGTNCPLSAVQIQLKHVTVSYTSVAVEEPNFENPSRNSFCATTCLPR